MKNIRKYISLVMVLLLTMCLFAGCGKSGTEEKQGTGGILSIAGLVKSEEDKIQELGGIWVTTSPDSEENALTLLNAIEFYEEEIALVDLTSLDEAFCVEFCADKTYYFAYELNLLRDCVRSFYQNAFASLYQGRNSLSALYEVDFSAMSEAEFQQFYAELYGFSSFSGMIEEMTARGYDYDALSGKLETGTYYIDGNDIMCTITGETQAESLGYKVDGDTLTLIYVDGIEYYTKLN